MEPKIKGKAFDYDDTRDRKFYDAFVWMFHPLAKIYSIPFSEIFAALYLDLETSSTLILIFTRGGNFYSLV